MVESERGCGWRQIGGCYLVCDAISTPCDGLPVELKACGCCEFKVRQARSMQPIHAGYLANLMKDHDCRDDYPCPICWFAKGYPAMKERIRSLPSDSEERAKLEADLPKVFYLMFVSKEFYTPEAFLKEAKYQGISKRVAANSLPKGFKVGTNWVFLGHGQVPFKSADGSFTRYTDGIFYAFKPTRLELILWKGTDDRLIADYEEAGYTVVLLEKTEENLKRHGNGAPPPLPYGFKRTKNSKGRKKVESENQQQDESEDEDVIVF